MYNHLPMLPPLSMPPPLYPRLLLLVLLQLLLNVPLSLRVILPTDYKTTPLLVPRLWPRPAVPQPSCTALLPQKPLLLTRPCFFSALTTMQSSAPYYRPFKRLLRRRFLTPLTLWLPLLRKDSVPLPVRPLSVRHTLERTARGSMLAVPSSMLLLRRRPRRRPVLPCMQLLRQPFTMPLCCLWRTPAERVLLLRRSWPVTTRVHVRATLAHVLP